MLCPTQRMHATGLWATRNPPFSAKYHLIRHFLFRAEVPHRPTPSAARRTSQSPRHVLGDDTASFFAQTGVLYLMGERGCERTAPRRKLKRRGAGEREFSRIEIPLVQIRKLRTSMVHELGANVPLLVQSRCNSPRRGIAHHRQVAGCGAQLRATGPLPSQLRRSHCPLRGS
jgi:hypothetical protein